MSSAEMLNALGSDLAFSVSFTIAAELRDSAIDAQMRDDELILVVLLISIVLGALPASIANAKDAFMHCVSKWTPPPAPPPAPAPARPPVRPDPCQCCCQCCVQRCKQDSANESTGVSTRTCPPPPEPIRSDDPLEVAIDGKTILGFLQLLVDIGRRISMSLAIQLVSASVTTRQPLRGVRVLTLFSVAVFFLFLQSGAAVILIKR